MKVFQVAPFVLLLLNLAWIPETVNSAKILFYFPLSTYSHRITAWPLATKLAEKGHSVTFLQGVKNRNPHPNVTDIIPAGIAHPADINLVDMRLKHGQNFIYLLSFLLPGFGVTMCEQFLGAEKNLQWIEENTFDLVFIDALFNDCAYGIAWKWKAKTAIFGTTHMADWFPDSFGVPDESSAYPTMLFSSDMPLTYLTRVKAALTNPWMYLYKEFKGNWVLDGILRDKLKSPEMPSVSDLQRETRLVLLNTHYSEELPRALPPMFQSVGGMHVQENVKPLPKDMEDFVKKSGANGFIYVSFGSEADLAKGPERIRKIFFNAIGRIKGNFMWKWDGERPVDMPTNVFTSSWMPQQDILGHPKCKGFITHGGLLSMQEAVYHAVPMIVFPVFAEQDYNAERLHRTGRGIRLELSTLKESDLEQAIERLLTDPSFKREMTVVSQRFKDRPEKPVDTAVWWTEYILRHDDTSHLRPHAISQYWFQRRQLDVWALIGIILLLIRYLIFRLVRSLLRRLYWVFMSWRVTTTPGKKPKRKQN